MQCRESRKEKMQRIDVGTKVKITKPDNKKSKKEKEHKSKIWEGLGRKITVPKHIGNF